jgi:hypothetical protein
MKEQGIRSKDKKQFLKNTDFYHPVGLDERTRSNE